MKYIISQTDLADLKAKVQSWLRTIYNHKHYHKTKKRVTSYLNLCNQFYLEPITLNKLVKSIFTVHEIHFINELVKFLLLIKIMILIV